MQPTRLVWRSALGWSPHSPAARANPKKGLVVHYDYSNLGLARKPHRECLEYWHNTRDYHVRSRGWADIGYSWFACPHGHVIEGRGLYRYQAAQGTTVGNRDYYSVTLAGGPDEDPTEAQIDAVRELRAWLMEPDTSISGQVFGHRDFIGTSCPGDRAYALVRGGIFEQQPGSAVPGDRATEEDDMVGLSKGDTGERVRYLQVILMKAGFDLPEFGADGHYGDETEAAVLAARKSQGSNQDFGDRITGWAAAQIMCAFVQSQGGGGASGDLPASETVQVSGQLTVKR